MSLERPHSTGNDPCSLTPPSSTKEPHKMNHSDISGRSLRSTISLYVSSQSNSSINSFSGAMAGVASGIVTCPLDVIKTRLQTQCSFRAPNSGQRKSPKPNISYHGMAGTARLIWKYDGLRGMYRGLGPMLLGYFPTWAVYMCVYENSKEYFYGKIENKWIARLYASLTAGACSTLSTNPIWVIKTRLMSQVGSRASEDLRTPWHYKSTLDAAAKIYRAEGLAAFYSGLAPALLGLTHVAIQFPLYEFFKTQITGLEMGENKVDDQNSHWHGVAISTFLSKLCATSTTYPHEVLRSRLQTQQRPVSIPPGEMAFHGPDTCGHNQHHLHRIASSDGMIHVPRYHGIIRSARTILQEEGWRAFYSGMGTNMVRAIPAAMTTMLTYEALKRYLFDLQEQGKLQVE